MGNSAGLPTPLKPNAGRLGREADPHVQEATDVTQGPSQPGWHPGQDDEKTTGAGPFETWSDESGGATNDPNHHPDAYTQTPLERTLPGFGTEATEGSSFFGTGSNSEPPPNPGSPPGSSSDSLPLMDAHASPSDESIGVQGAVQAGQILFGRYQAEKLIGEGGMGTVWLIKHLELDTLRALKLIVSGIAFDPQAQARFKREARVMAKLSHPHAVVVHDARMGRDAAFIEMEYIRGRSLNKVMEPGVPLPLGLVARLAAQLCDVLEDAHRQRIVHRDLKPANLMLLDGRPPGREHLKVLDFGIAKILEGESETLEVHTHTGSFLGSAPYSSPEQASSGMIDGRSDLYSIGIILYEMLTGYRPFTGPLTRLIYDHLYTAPPRFEDRNPNCQVPEAVEYVVLRCLAKDPADRPQTALGLLNELTAAFPAGLLEEGQASLPVTEHDAGLHSPPQTAHSFPHHTIPAHLPGEPPPYPYPPGQQPTFSHAPTAPDFPATPPIQEPKPRPDSQEWESEPPLPPRPLWKRLVPVFLLLALIAGGFYGAHRLRKVPSPLDPPTYPTGYKPDEHASLVRGLPTALIRESDGARFVLIEGGTFKMGNDGFDPTGGQDDDDQPAHPVELSDFWIQETEVTNRELETYFTQKHVDVADRPKRWLEAIKRIERKGPKPDRFPVVGVPHELAEKYAQSVGGQLPTEAQWEYAARSRGKAIPYVWGSEPKPDMSNANVDSLGQVSNLPTFTVGYYPKDKTEQGLFDMTGNVREWCRDVWAPYQSSTSPLRNPTGPARGGETTEATPYVTRGGSFAVWKDQTRTTRPRRPLPDDLTARNLTEDGTAEDLGFRVVIEPKTARE